MLSSTISRLSAKRLASATGNTSAAKHATVTQRFAPREGRLTGPPFLMPVAGEREDAGLQNYPKRASSTNRQAPQHVRPPINSAMQTI